MLKTALAPEVVLFSSVQEVSDSLRKAGYIADPVAITHGFSR
jgi:hypothetical protein